MTQEGRPRRTLRNFETGDYLEIFFVSAVSAVLLIRLFLQLTGYPSVGGDVLHLAHLLWGGVLMLAGVVVLLSFVGDGALRFAALIAGVGFGAFIDEVGKFVTRDNDYFYQPAVALIYIVFVALFITMHAIHGRRRYTPEEYLVNALRKIVELARHDMDEDELRQAKRYLSRSDPASPLAKALSQALDAISPLPKPRPSGITRVRRKLRRTYARIARLPGFDRAVILFFVGQFVFKLGFGAYLVFTSPGWRGGYQGGFVSYVVDRLQVLSGLEMAQLAASGVSGLFIALGIAQIRWSRLAALKSFERAILVSILLVQPFSFYHEQFAALLELLFNLTILLALRALIRLERSRQRI